MKKSLQQRQEEFLSGTLKYYTKDVSRRCIKDGNCLYSPVNAGNPNSQGCAIGRWLKPELQIELDKSLTSVCVDKTFQMLPTVLQNLSKSFLTACQNLHDGSDYWNDEGLTQAGKKKVDSIIEDYNLNPQKFIKWSTKNT